ncbi:hypothetical protein GCM10010498_64390 [Streptomyces cavourensis]|nr:hypothetical protein GCM10010498_64390 [Streptomyces cavourensis]
MIRSDNRMRARLGEAGGNPALTCNRVRPLGRESDSPARDAYRFPCHGLQCEAPRRPNRCAYAARCAGRDAPRTAVSGAARQAAPYRKARSCI